MKIELKILDPRLPAWGFPKWGSDQAAGLDLHACLDGPVVLQPQAPAILISAGIAFRIGDPEWCALVLPRSGLGHKRGLVLGNTIGVVDADYARHGTAIPTWAVRPSRSIPVTVSPSSSSPASRGRNLQLFRYFPSAGAASKELLARPA